MHLCGQRVMITRYT